MKSYSTTTQLGAIILRTTVYLFIYIFTLLKRQVLLYVVRQLSHVDERVGRAQSKTEATETAEILQCSCFALLADIYLSDHCYR